jgi:Uma2 family endonuclease
MLVGEKLVTAEDLARMPEARRFELVKGELVEMSPPGIHHGRFASWLNSRLRAFVESHALGEVFVEAGFRLERHPDTVRGPDISFLTAARIAREGLPEEGFFPGAPDLAVEIVSPGDLDAEVQGKVKDYLDHGARVVWVIRPKLRTVTVHLPDGTSRVLKVGDTLTSEDLLPGFSLPLGELFA